MDTESLPEREYNRFALLRKVRFYNPIIIFMAVFLGYVDGRREFGERWI